MQYSAYVICATPRTGSTMLCDLLAATGVAGQPNSYLRDEDIEYWAQQWGVVAPTPWTDHTYDRAYLTAMRRAGMAETQIFGLRLMWESLSEAVRRLDSASGHIANLPVHFTREFGPTLFVRLTRRDKVAQAISFIRARQTGLWHVNADGSERERTDPDMSAVFDRDEINRTYQKLLFQEEGWTNFFSQHGIKPITVEYERLAADPQAVLADVLEALGCDPTKAAAVGVGTARLADEVNAIWMQRMNCP